MAVRDQQSHLETVIPSELAGLRLDQALARIFGDFSRTTLKSWILKGQVLVNAKCVKPRETVAGGERIELWIEPGLEDKWVAQAIPLNIIYQDEDLIVINKPAGLVVHPGAGNRAGTLLNALLHHDLSLASLPRAGIVHRLDKDTSGILVVARSTRAYTHLISQIQSRSLQREYQAIVNGVMVGGGRVDATVGRHPRQRTRMAVVARGKEAITHYRVLQRFRAHTHIALKLETGRTHQIRVHMAHLHYPLVGDPNYSGRPQVPAKASPRLVEALRNFKRQALHASRLALLHPSSGKPMGWSVPIPEDMDDLLEALAEDFAKSVSSDCKILPTLLLTKGSKTRI